MNILPLNNYVFDDYIKNYHEHSLNIAAAELERVDKEIWEKLAKNRYKLIRYDSRTILTSIGAITFRRRYVSDTLKKQYFYPLDQQFNLPKRKRLSNELTLRALKGATELTYRQIGENLVYNETISKSTICRIVKNCQISIDLREKFDDIGVIHLQIDEKYMSKIGTNRKSIHYTATIFDGRKCVGNKGKHKLTHRQLTSAESLEELKENIKQILLTKFGVTVTTPVFVSGDFASYIQIFPDNMDYCSATYVPDKYHSCQALADELGVFQLPTSRNVLEYLAETTNQKIKDFVSDSFKKVVRCYRRNQRSFEIWDLPIYEGCSQEGINSHYYAARFGSRANKFKPETISKLCRIKEALLNSWVIKAKDSTYKIQKFKIRIKDFGTYIPSYEINPGLSQTAGKFHKELDKWLNPTMII